ncbi:hypothetical protein Mapa_008704 [Marchantia paleacea]|nr:hypothetical protein Mapa_008704 [Marchantia paleacea]
MANLQVFEDYFRRADLDKDGKISGGEAVGFFQGANLPQQVLAKIWQFADQGQTGFLSKLEFYNALKLITVAQTGRELTPEIVRAALAGPAAAQIPAPRIVTPGAPPQPSGPQGGLGAAGAPGRPAPGPAQGGPGGFGDPFASSAPGAATPSRWQSQPSALPSQLPSQPSLPPQAAPARPGSASGQRPAGGLPQDTWPSIRSSASASSLQNYGQQAQAQAQAPPASSVQSMQSFLGGPNAAATPAQPAKDPFGSLGSGPDLFSSLSSTPNPKSASTGTISSLTDSFGGDPFAANNNKSLALTSQPPAQKPGPANNVDAFSGLGDFGGGGFRAEPAVTMALVPTSAPAPAPKDPQAAPGSHLTRSLVPTSSAASGPGFSAPSPAGPGTGAAPWPRMTQVDVQRYTRVFYDVDTDKDGKITGGQARDLFLSWGLPREVLKQVWDLSDQDGDSELSLREFCTALYLMERFREGRPLPPVLPTGFHFDEPPQQTSVAASRIEQARSSMAQHTAGFNVPSWQQNPGMLQPTGPGPAGMQPPTMDRSLPQQGSVPGGGMPEPSQPGAYKSKAPVLEPHLLAQLSRDEQDTLKSRHKDAQEADKKSHDLDKEIMDYKEKAEYYRTKLQEIILFKSRCDNRLAEIQERVSADKREMEALAKRYDERFKAGGEVNSRLVAEEAAFRDIQEKKIELYNAIAKIEQGGDANGLLQSKADRIHHDLDELKKALNERSKRLGLEVKASAPTEQSFGWQPGVQDNTSEWDEDWDKFDDEGFVSVQDFMDDATGADFSAPPPPPKRAVAPVEVAPVVESTTPKIESSPFTDVFDFSSEHDSKVENAVEAPSGPTFMASGPASPRAESESGRSGIESPPRDLSTSGSLAVDKSSFDTPEKTNNASLRYDNAADSDDFGGDVFNDPPAFSSKTNSFDQDPPLFHSGSDAFGGGGVSWSTAFNHDDEADSGVRASWGMQSSAPSTQASLDVGGKSRFGKSDSSTFGDSFDFGSSHLTSPGRVTDEPNSPASHRGNGDFRNSEEYDTFAPMGGATFDRSASLFGGKDTTTGSSFFDSPANPKAGNAFARFDSFSSPSNNPAFSGVAGGDDRQDNSTMGSSYFDSPVHPKAGNDATFARFDSFSSVKGGADAGHAKRGMFGSFDDGDDAFTASAFGAGGDSKKWSAF